MKQFMEDVCHTGLRYRFIACRAVLFLLLVFIHPGEVIAQSTPAMADCHFKSNGNFCHAKISGEVTIGFSCNAMGNSYAEAICKLVMQKVGFDPSTIQGNPNNSPGSAIPFASLGNLYEEGEYLCSDINFLEVIKQSNKEVFEKDFPGCDPTIGGYSGGGDTFLPIYMPGDACREALRRMKFSSSYAANYFGFYALGYHDHELADQPCRCSIYSQYEVAPGDPPVDPVEPPPLPPPPTIPPTPTPTINICQVCSSVPGDDKDISTHRGKCCDCFINRGGAWTALGCVAVSPTAKNGFVTVLLQFGIGIAGGIAFLLILWGGFRIITSTGNPDQLQEGRDLVIAAISGLLLVIFSLFILRQLGVNILGIPGFL